jgi:hypothetical protein
LKVGGGGTRVLTTCWVGVVGHLFSERQLIDVKGIVCCSYSFL